MTWKWLNDPEIKQLTNSADFTIEDQKKWFNGLKNKQDYKIWGLTYHKKPVGVCGIKNITQNDCEYWGYIGEKEYWGRGFGSAILEYMEYEARKLILRSIWLQVINSNERALRLYKKNGYVVENVENNIVFMRKTL